MAKPRKHFAGQVVGTGVLASLLFATGCNGLFSRANHMCPPRGAMDAGLPPAQGQPESFAIPPEVTTQTSFLAPVDSPEPTTLEQIVALRERLAQCEIERDQYKVEAEESVVANRALQKQLAQSNTELQDANVQLATLASELSAWEEKSVEIQSTIRRQRRAHEFALTDLEGRLQDLIAEYELKQGEGESGG